MKPGHSHAPAPSTISAASDRAELADRRDPAVRDRDVRGAADGSAVAGEDRRAADDEVETTADMPPSTYRIWPLTKSDAADERKTTAPASSDGSPQRPAGTRLRSHASNSAFVVSGSVSSVRK